MMETLGPAPNYFAVHDNRSPAVVNAELRAQLARAHARLEEGAIQRNADAALIGKMRQALAMARVALEVMAMIPLQTSRLRLRNATGFRPRRQSSLEASRPTGKIL